MMEISDQVSELPSRLTPKVEFSISPPRNLRNPAIPPAGLPAARSVSLLLARQVSLCFVMCGPFSVTAFWKSVL